jgi:hypothetical protein
MTRKVIKSEQTIQAVKDTKFKLDYIRKEFRDNFALGELVEMEQASELISKVIKSSEARPMIVEEIR